MRAARREEIARLDEGGSGQAHGHVDDAVLHEPIVGDDDDQRPARPQMDEFDMAQRPVRLRRHDQPGAMGEPGQRIGRLGQDIRQAAADGGALPFD